MHNCLNMKSSTSSTETTQPTSSQGGGNSSDGTPRTPGTSAVPCPTVNLSREYAIAVQTSSYSEIWSKIHPVEQWESEEPSHDQQLLLSQVLQPNHESVEEALKRATPTCFTQLISSYFEHSEKTCHLLLLLHHSIHHVRSLYVPVHDLVDALPSETDSMTQLQCNRAFDVFVQFEQDRNPIPCPDSHNFQDMQMCFSQFKQEVDLRLGKSRNKVRRLNCGTTSSAVCLIVTVVGVTISAIAIAIATHALVALVAVPTCPLFLPSRFRQREMVHMEQLDAAARSAYVLHNDLDTIDCLVSRVYTAVEGDKLLIRLGLDRGKDKHPIYEVVKQLRKTRGHFMDQLMDLEEHICLCFAAINRARSLLLEEIDLQQEIVST